MHEKRLLIFAVIGGDIRHAKLAELLAAEGHEVRVFALDRYAFTPAIKSYALAKEACKGVNCVIMPMPLTREQGMLNAPLSGESHDLTDLFSAVEPGTVTLAGVIKEDALSLAKTWNIRLIDYFLREELAISNAAITVEGAIQIAMEELPITINQSKCLVIGNGRIGKMLAEKLRALGAKTWVMARKPVDLAHIRIAGHIPLTVSTLDWELEQFQIIFNTAPALILGRQQLRKINSKALIIDVASRPGGVDWAAAQELGVRAKHALSLPGKVAPVTSAEIILETINYILEEEGVR